MIFDYFSRTSARRAEIRKNRPDRPLWQELKSDGTLASIGIAVIFAILASAVLMLRQDVIPYRPGQYVRQAIHSRVDFSFRDKDLLTQAQRDAREAEPRVYKPNAEVWTLLEQHLKDLPDVVVGKSPAELPPPLRDIFDRGTITALAQYRTDPRRRGYNDAVHHYVQSLQTLVILPESQRQEELARQVESSRVAPAFIRLPAPVGQIEVSKTFAAPEPGHEPSRELQDQVGRLAFIDFREELQPKVVAYTLATLQPTHVLDEDATTEARNVAAERVPPSRGEISYKANQIIKREGVLDERDWQLLKAENDTYLASLTRAEILRSKLGLAGMVFLVTAILAGYVRWSQPRVVRNHARGAAIATLLLAMLLLAELAAIGTGPLYLFGLAPTILVAMILSIAYDRRFAMGVAAMHALLVTIALDQGAGFFLILYVGIFTAGLLLDDIRTRSKLIEVGGLTAVAMMIATFAVGAVSLHPIEPVRFIARNCLHAGAAGLSVGFIVLGILPFVEKSFRITTSMTLLELADASQPLLRRLALEAPGTYNHSLQVATLAEAAADTIGINSLLCRVGSYYHDIGKINKADYFIENQSMGGENRHINLNPSVSLLIIIGHVKDGVEMAKEYNLPTSIIPIIQQHHGTTLVEYFYHRACTQKDKDSDPNCAQVSETQYRYPGPKPKSKEVAVVMLADAVESATRAMAEPTASRIESLVHDIAMRRLLDGQFDECDLTMRELELVERSLVKTLLGIYHGRIAYPSTAAVTDVAPPPAVRSAS